MTDVLRNETDLTPESGRRLRVAVIGGGISGLASAYYLTKQGVEVTLLESSDRFGGLGTYFDYEGDRLDRYYHVMLPTDDHLLALLDELGLGSSVYWKETGLGFYYGRKLYGLSTPLDLLRFSPAHFTDRIRLGLTALYASHVAKPEPLDDITVADWLTRLSGKRAFDKLWRPLLEAKFGDAYKQIPALWYWASFNREKGTKKEVKGYIRGGYDAISEALLARLKGAGAELRLNTPVDAIDLDERERVTLRFQGEARAFDRVISTVPFFHLRKIVEGGRVEPYLDGIHSDIDYQGVVNVVVLLKKSISPYYWVPVVDCGVPFQGIVETTKTIDLSDTGNRHMVYLLNYVHRTTELFKRDENGLRQEYVDALLGLMPHVKREDILDSLVFKAPFVEPLYTPGYGRRKPPFELVRDRVYLATSTQVYPQVTSWNSSTGIAKEAVSRALARARASA